MPQARRWATGTASGSTASSAGTVFGTSLEWAVQPTPWWRWTAPMWRELWTNYKVFYLLKQCLRKSWCARWSRRWWPRSASRPCWWTSRRPCRRTRRRSTRPNRPRQPQRQKGMLLRPKGLEHQSLALLLRQAVGNRSLPAGWTSTWPSSTWQRRRRSASCSLRQNGQFSRWSMWTSARTRSWSLPTGSNSSEGCNLQDASARGQGRDDDGCCSLWPTSLWDCSGGLPETSNALGNVLQSWQRADQPSP